MGITTVWESSAMSAVSRREPRQYADFSSVPPSQWNMHDRLENWARWCDSRTGQAVAPGFDLYRSSEARRAYGDETSIPVDKMDAQKIAKGVAALPDKHRRAIQWCYCRPYKAVAMARELGVSLEGMAELIRHGRLFLINRKV